MTADQAAVGERSSTSAGPRQRYGAVLVAIVVVFAIQGIASPNKWEQIVVSVLLGFVLLLSLWEAHARRAVMLIAVVVVVGVVLVSIVEWAIGNIDSAETRLPDALVVALTPPAIVLGVMRDLRLRREVTLQTVFGVLCVYILLGMFFANVYVSDRSPRRQPVLRRRSGGERCTLHLLQLHDDDHRRLRRSDRSHGSGPHPVGIRGSSRADLSRHRRFAHRDEPREAASRGSVSVWLSMGWRHVSRGARPRPRARYCFAGRAEK